MVVARIVGICPGEAPDGTLTSTLKRSGKPQTDVPVIRLADGYRVDRYIICPVVTAREVRGASGTC